MPSGASRPAQPMLTSSQQSIMPATTVLWLALGAALCWTSAPAASIAPAASSEAMAMRMLIMSCTTHLMLEAAERRLRRSSQEKRSFCYYIALQTTAGHN